MFQTLFQKPIRISLLNLVVLFSLSGLPFFSCSPLTESSHTNGIPPQFNQAEGLKDGTIWSLISTDKYIFAGTGQGVFRSSDDGATWTDVNNGVPKTLISSLTASDSQIFARTSNSDLFRSSDNGGSDWRGFLGPGLSLENHSTFPFTGYAVAGGR